MAMVLLADDAYAFMVSWELMALASFFLVTTNHRIPEIQRAGYLYLLIAHIGAISILLCFGVLQANTGDYTFANMREQHHRHAGEKQVVLQADEPRRRAFAFAKVAAGENRDAGAGEPQQHEEERRQRVEPQVERQARKADREDRDLGRGGQRAQRERRQGDAHDRRQREEHAADDAEITQCRDSGEPHREPRRDDEQYPVEREGRRVHTVSTGQSR